jgi:hypothetical protein
MAQKRLPILDGNTHKNLQVQADGSVAEVVSDQLLSVRVDKSNATYTYIGSAAPGSDVASPVWRISRLSSDGEELWANGSIDFNQPWQAAVYTQLSYS